MATKKTDQPIRIKLALASALRDFAETQGWNQTEAAKHFGVTQPRVSDVFNDRTERFTIEFAVRMATAAGLHVEWAVVDPAAVS